MSCIQVRLPSGGYRSFNSKSEVYRFLKENPNVAEFLKNTQEFVLHNLKANSVMDETQHELLRKGKPVQSYVNTKDQFHYYSGRTLKVLNIAENKSEWDAPSLELHEEGQAFINSPAFKVGTPVYFTYSENTPYNKVYGYNNFKSLAQNNSPALKDTKLSAVVFVDKAGQPLDQSITNDIGKLQSLLEQKEASVKYVGSYFEYRGQTEQDPEIVKEVQQRAITYKKKVAGATGVVTQFDSLHIHPEVYEVVTNISGFNKRLEYSHKKDENRNEEAVKKLQSISTRPWFDKNQVPLLGIVRSNKDLHDHIQLNNTDIITDPSIVPAMVPGDAYLFLESNINLGNSYKDKGKNYFPIRMVTKSWADNPIFSKRFEGIIKKIMKGIISFDIKKENGKNVIVNIQDASTLAFNKAKPFMQEDWINRIWAQEPKYNIYLQNYSKEAQANGEEVTKEGLAKYLEKENPTFTGAVYSSLYKNKAVDFLAALQEFVGLQRVLTNDLANILRAAQAYTSRVNADQSNLNDLYDEFFNEDDTITTNAQGEPTVLSAKRSQISVDNYHDIDYLKNYVYPYGVLLTDLSKDRPTGDVSFWTSPVSSLEETQVKFDNIGSFLNFPQNKRYSNKFDTTTLSKEEAGNWISRNFPGATVHFQKELVDSLFNGSFNLATDAVTLAEDYVSTGVLKEEFVHFAFKYESLESQNELLKEVSEITGIGMEEPIALEEKLAEILRADPRDITNSKLLSFLDKIINWLTALFNRRSAIRDFSNRFHHGAFQNLKAKTTDTEGIRYGFSPLYATLNNKQRKFIVDAINRNYLVTVLKGQKLEDRIKWLTALNNISNPNYSSTSGLTEIYKDVEKYIKDIVGKLGKSKSEVDLKDAAALTHVLNMMGEPSFVIDLYADLKDTHGITVRYEAEEVDEDKLGIVKETEIDPVKNLGSNIKILLNNIPDIREVKNIEGATQAYVIKNGVKTLTAKTDVRDLQGVEYDKLFNLYTYNLSLSDKVNTLLHTISGSQTMEEMVSKLQDIAETGPAWVKVLNFKLAEEKAFGEDFLLKELWAGIGQKHYIEFIKLYSYADGLHIGVSNQTDYKKALNSKLINSAKSFGIDSEGKKESNESIETKLTAITQSLKAITTRNFSQRLPNILQSLSLTVNPDDIKKMEEGFSEYPGMRVKGFKTDLITKVIGTLEQLIKSLRSNGYQYDFQVGERSVARAQIGLLSHMIASAGSRQQLTSFMSVERTKKQSYRNPNFLLRTFAGLFTNPELVDNKYKRMLGTRYNPLLDLVKATPESFKLKVYDGNETTKKSFDNMNTYERIADFIEIGNQNIFINKRRVTVGNYWIGNLSDSGTGYVLQAPVLGDTEIWDGYHTLMMSELDYLFSGIPDKNLKNNRTKGFTYPGLNQMLFGKDKLTEADLAVENYNTIKDALFAKEPEVKSLIKNFWEDAFEKFYKDKLENSGLLSKVLTGTRTKEDLAKWYNNINFYQTSSLYFFMGHPYFAKDQGDISKRAKQWHTDGQINASGKEVGFIMLKDDVEASSPEFLESLNDLPEYYQAIAKAAYEKNKSTDSAAYGNLALLRRIDNEWNADKEALYQAELKLDIQAINELSSKVSFGPTKLGVFTHEIQKAAFTEFGINDIPMPTIQKYGFTWMLPSFAFRTKEGGLQRPDVLAEKLKKSVKEVYALYKFPKLAKLQFEIFKTHEPEMKVGYAYYGSGAKLGYLNEYSLDSDEQPIIRKIQDVDLKKVTEQPNKNNLDYRVLTRQPIFQIPGLIEDNVEYDLGSDINNMGIFTYLNEAGKVNGDKMRDLFEKALSLDIEEAMGEIPFWNKGKVDMQNLSYFLLERARNSSWSTTETMKSLDLNEKNTNFKIRPYSSSVQKTVFSAVNSIMNDALRIKVKAPSYKNVGYSGSLNTRLIDLGGTKALEVETRVAKWPELQRYQLRKLKEQGLDLNDPQVWYNSDQEIVRELNAIGFKMMYNRVPTEAPYSYLRLKIVDFLPNHAGNAMEIAKEFTTQTGGDFDGDAMFGIISALEYGDKLKLVKPSLMTKEGRQSLYARIYDEALKHKGVDQRIPGEYNRLDELAKDIPIPNLHIGGLDYNLYYQKLNDFSSEAISPNAVVMTAQTFMKGHFQKNSISFKAPFPVLDKDYGNSITKWSVETENGEIPKLQLLANNVGASVNMPKDATLTRLGLNKELDNIKSTMNVMGVDFPYAIAFLRHPVIQNYIKEKEILQTLLSGYKYNIALSELKTKLLGQPVRKIYEDTEVLNTPISLKTLEEGKQSDLVLAKFFMISDRANDLTSLTVNFQGLTKPGEPKPEAIRKLYTELSTLSTKFDNIESLMPIIGYNNRNEFYIKNVTGISIMDQSAQVLLAKIKALQAVSTYFHPNFIKTISLASSANGVKLSDEAYLALNEFMRRMVKAKQVKPLKQLLHLGKSAQFVNNEWKYYPGSLGFVRNYLQNAWNNTTDIEERGTLQNMMTVTSFLDYSKDDLKYQEDGRIKTTKDLRLVSGFFQDQTFAENFEKGFMAMLNSPNRTLREFAEDLRAYSLYKGWGRENSNWGNLVPAMAWETFEDQFDKDLDTFNPAELLRTATLNYPEYFAKPLSYSVIKKHYDAKEKELGKLNLNQGFELPDSVYYSLKGEALPQFYSVLLKEELKLYKLDKGKTYRLVKQLGTIGLDDFDSSAALIVRKDDVRNTLPVTEDEIPDFKPTNTTEVASNVPVEQPIEFTQEVVDIINKNLPQVPGQRQYTLESLQALPEDRQKKAWDYYLKCIK